MKLLIPSLLLLLAFPTSQAFPSLLCPRSRLEDSALPHDQCFPYHHPTNFIIRNVSEINGTTLEMALNLYKNVKGTYVALLFYAEWCPFSKALRVMFDALASAFPEIIHAAVEDSSLRLSTLSQHGVHSYPALFLLNKTQRVRYYGPRTIKDIGQFYNDITGLRPIDPNSAGTDGQAFLQNASPKGSLHPFAKPFELWLHDDMCLTFATVFLVVRLLFYLVPKLLTGIKHYWPKKENYQQNHRTLLRQTQLQEMEQEQRINNYNERIKGKSVRNENLQENKETGKGVLSVPGWSSSSLAAVTLSEGSSSRATEDGRENGHVFRGHLWG